MSEQPPSTAFRHIGFGVQILNHDCCLSGPTRQQGLFLRGNGMFGATKNSSDDFTRTLLQHGHPAVVARLTNLPDLRVNVQGKAPTILGWGTFNNRFHIHVDTLPWWGSAQQRKPHAKDMLLSKRPSTTKDAFSRHELYFTHGESIDGQENQDPEDTHGLRDSCSDKGGGYARLGKGGKARRVNASQTEEVASQTEHGHHPDGCTSKHTHSSRFTLTAAAPYLPLNCGSRFSMKERTPSWWSSVWKQ